MSQSQAEAELQRRTVEVERTTRVLEETIDKFETKKLQDLKVGKFSCVTIGLTGCDYNAGVQFGFVEKVTVQMENKYVIET